jgi:uncharacterized protein YeaO (DUF488 family)
MVRRLTVRKKSATDIRLKRAYEPVEATDGSRILVDRLWPRGISKKSAHIDLWLKEIAPSTQLRKWFGHDPAKWTEFRKRYFQELRGSSEPLEKLLKQIGHGTVTLVYGAKDEKHNDAVVLKDFLENHTGR